MTYMIVYLSPDRKVFRIIKPMMPEIDKEGNLKRDGFKGDWHELANSLDPVRYGFDIVKL